MKRFCLAGFDFHADILAGARAVSRQWGIKRMGPFLENAERLGIEMQEAA